MNSETKGEPCLKSPDPASSLRIELSINLFSIRTVTNHEGTICGAEDAIISPNYHFFLIIILLCFLIFWIRSKVIEDDEK